MTTRRKLRRDRSPEAKQWQYLYSLTIWRGEGGLRDMQLRREPLCEPCKRRGKLVRATVAHHLEPHKGDYQKFVNGALESACDACHNGPIQSEEKRGLGFSKAVDPATGLPADKSHPFWG